MHNVLVVAQSFHESIKYVCGCSDIVVDLGDGVAEAETRYAWCDHVERCGIVVWGAKSAVAKGTHKVCWVLVLATSGSHNASIKRDTEIKLSGMP